MKSTAHLPGLIRQIRIAKHWSQEALAEYMQTNQASISRWERGAVYPGFAAVRRLEVLAQEVGLQSLSAIGRVVQSSPFPMLLVDRHLQVIAASASSGFTAGRTVAQQTPADELQNLRTFARSLDEAGFGTAEGTDMVDYAFTRGEYTAGAIVVAIMVCGEVFAVVQKR